MKIKHSLSLLHPYHIALVALGLLFFLPFSLAWRTGPQPGFFLEAMALGLSLIMILAVAASGLMPRKIPAASWFFILCALFFPAQSWYLSLPYAGYAGLMCVLFLTLAGAAWALAGLRTKIGLDALLSVIATALLMAVLWQSLVCWMQFFGLTHHFFGVMMHPPEPYYVYGQLGQRNHLGHFMLWGLLAATYLFAERRLHAFLSIFALLLIVTTLGLIGSRTIVLYVLALLPICIFYALRRPAQRRMAIITATALIAVLCAQWLLPHVVELIKIPLQNGLDRAAGGGETASRIHEWHKAWLVFLDHPTLGKGWMSYAYQSLDKSHLFSYADIPHPGVLFTHCHNLVLQLLAETGLLGTLLLCGGSLWMMRSLWTLPARTNALFIGGALSVSLIHSMLEYPLWYVYFFLPFFILMILATPAATSSPLAHSTTHHIMITISYGVLLAVLYQGFQYNRLMQLNTHVNADHCRDHAQQLHQFGAQNIWLAYYADVASTQCLGTIFPPQYSQQLPWLQERIRRMAHFRPFPTQAVQWGVLQAYNSETASAQKWLDMVWRYYPRRISADRQQMTQPTLIPLRQTAEAIEKIKEMDAQSN